MSEQTEATQVDPGSQVDVAEATPTLFIDTLPEDLRDNPTLKRFTNVGDLAKSYVNARQHIGENKLTLPGKHTTESEWNEIYSKLYEEGKIVFEDGEVPEDYVPHHLRKGDSTDEK